MSGCRPISNCIACDGLSLKTVLDLGNQPPANSFKSSQTQDENFYPLVVNKCRECHHLQLSHMVNPDELFKHYLYVSGTSKTQLEYFYWFFKMVVSRIQKNTGRVLDIGCNDGSQLNCFKSTGFSTYGVDPATNLHQMSSNRHTVVCDYFNNESVQFPFKFDAIICQNAFAHNYDQVGFLRKCRTMLEDGGLAFITISQAHMIRNNEFDTVYHEHYSYYCVNSMKTICERAELHLVDVIEHPIHGGSYVFVISKHNNPSETIQKMIESEESTGLYSEDTYTKYALRANEIADEFKRTVEQFKNDGYTVAGYGSSAKGNTFLNFCDVRLDFIIDDNPLKQSLFTPGISIPIYSIDFLENYEQKPICYVPLAWNFFDEICKRLSEKTGTKSKYLRYFPRVEITER
jgi:2-polyprenyl-3-methyl-5-hydroxy-6-metoxy-1,4-benzoquinol methylase